MLTVVCVRSLAGTDRTKWECDPLYCVCFLRLQNQGRNSKSIAQFINHQANLNYWMCAPKCRLQFIQTPRFLVYFGEGVPQHRCSIIVSISIIFNSQTRQFCITPSGMIDGERICHSVHSQKVWCVARGVLPHKRFARRNWRYCSEQLVSAAALFPSPFILINGLQRSPMGSVGIVSDRVSIRSVRIRDL